MSSKQRNKSFVGLQSLQLATATEQTAEGTDETNEAIDGEEISSESADTTLSAASTTYKEAGWEEINPEPQILPSAFHKEAEPEAPVIAPPVAQEPQILQPTTLTHFMKHVTDELTGYLCAVSPTKAIRDTDGAKWQKFLLDVMMRILSEQDQQTFNEKWSALLDFFHKNKDNLFNPNYVYRFVHKWNGSEAEINAFRMLVWVAMETSDLTKRAEGLSKIRMEKLQGLSVEQKNRLISFYS